MKLKVRGVFSTRFEVVEPFTTQIVAPRAPFPTLICEMITRMYLKISHSKRSDSWINLPGNGAKLGVSMSKRPPPTLNQEYRTERDLKRTDGVA